ncbi:methylamine utilization protein [uncultured Sphingomonas sp.]|uniref:methylamine utilization protein n=1 Tax=uncultured Sphingomonas sp. TaxID=158754 RepID=UPI0025DE9A52|nr:methylamine utilization protein [uncultured Sphingomonas sp.]
MRNFRIVMLALVALPIATTAKAAPVLIQVVGVDGRPLSGAVVTVTMPGTAAPAPRGPYVVAQRNIQFDPRVLIVPVGATVSFPNFDKVRHHVYSFSKPKKFELKLFGRDESRNVVFDKPGAVALGCNIHDAMNGVVYVTASPYTALTDAAGRVRMNVAPGSGRVAVWHPSIRSAGNTLEQPASVAASGLTTTLQLHR